MRHLKSRWLILAMIPLAGCEQKAPQSSDTAQPQLEILTAANLGDQSVLSAGEYLLLPEYKMADREQGQRQAQICRACHSFEAGGAHMIGPNLSGFFGREIGANEGFDYSEVAIEANFVWTPRALDAWLSQPGRFLPGNSMSFVGVSDADDRADLIAYLLEATGVDK